MHKTIQKQRICKIDNKNTTQKKHKKNTNIRDEFGCKNKILLKAWNQNAFCKNINNNYCRTFSLAFATSINISIALNDF
jgi:hypothetical protein